MGHFRKSCKDLSAFVCVGLILTLGFQKLTIFGTQWDAEQTDYPLKLLAEDMQSYRCPFKSRSFCKLHWVLNSSSRSHANTADFNTLIHAYICVYTKLFWKGNMYIHLCINICFYYIFKKIYSYKYGRILSCLMSGEVSLCGWWQLCWSVNRMYVIHSFVTGARVVTSWWKYNRCCMRLRVGRVMMIRIM